MTEVILHIGMGKTGTTALQSYLSFNPVLVGEKQTYEYLAVNSVGELISGNSLEERAKASRLFSVSSTPDLGRIRDIDVTKQLLSEYSQKTGHTLILSQEDWARRVAAFASENYLAKLGIYADVVIYVRPQVEWFQSGWWQWWAWDEQFSKPEDVLEKWGTGFLNWGGIIRQWERLNNVRSVHIRLHSSDVVKDFADFLGSSDCRASSGDKIVNPTLGLLAIKLLRAFPSMRKVNDAHVDELLAELFPGDEKAPWVLSLDLAKKLLSDCRLENLEIAGRLQGNMREAMLQDQRWWDADFYKGKTVTSLDSLSLSRADLVQIVGNILERYLRPNGPVMPGK